MSNRLLPYDTIMKAHEGDPIAIQAVLDRYAGYIRYFSKMNGYGGYSTHFKTRSGGYWSNPIAAPSIACQKPAMAAYIRVACADQLAAADQREELERYAKDKGYEVAAAVAADGISGVHTEGIMNFLLNEAKRQDIGTILTRDTSRISRDTSSFMRFERKFRENGIRFEYLSKPDNELPVTPMMEAFETAYKKRRTKAPKHFG